MVRWRNVYQPRNPLFWIMMILNALSLVLAWITRTYSLNTSASVLVGIFAFGNALLGAWLLWRLLSTPPNLQAPETAAAQRDAPLN